MPNPGLPITFLKHMIQIHQTNPDLNKKSQFDTKLGEYFY